MVDNNKEKIYYESSETSSLENDVFFDNNLIINFNYSNYISQKKVNFKNLFIVI